MKTMKKLPDKPRVGRPPKEDKRLSVHVGLDPDVKEMLSNPPEGMSRSEYANVLLRKALNLPKRSS